MIEKRKPGSNHHIAIRPKTTRQRQDSMVCGSCKHFDIDLWICDNRSLFGICMEFVRESDSCASWEVRI